LEDHHRHAFLAKTLFAFTNTGNNTSSTHTPTSTRAQTSQSIFNHITAWVTQHLTAIAILCIIAISFALAICYILYKIVNKLTNSSDTPQAPKAYNNSINVKVWLNQVDQYQNETETQLQKHVDKQFIFGSYNTLIKGQLFMNAQEKNVLSQTIQLQSTLSDSATELNMPIVASHVKSLRQRFIEKINTPTCTNTNNNSNSASKTTTHLVTT
jgi:hypothetical protein